MADIIPRPHQLGLVPPEPRLGLLDAVRGFDPRRISPHVADALARLAQAGPAAMEWLTPAGDVVDMQQGSQTAWQGLKEQNPLGILAGTGTAVLGLAGTVMPGRPGQAVDTNAIADRIARYAEELGYAVERDRSKLSASKYVTVRPPGSDEPIQIRISDHELPPSYGPGGDFEVGSPESGHVNGWAGVVQRLAERVGKPVPARAQAELTRLQRQRDEAAALEARAQAQSQQIHADRDAMFAAARERIAQSPELSARLADLESRAAQLTGKPRRKLLDARNKMFHAVMGAD